MEKNIKHVSQCIAEKLVLNPNVVEKWVETNNFDMDDLAIIGGQITFSRIPILPLVGTIINNEEYKILEK